MRDHRIVSSIIKLEVAKHNSTNTTPNLKKQTNFKFTCSYNLGKQEAQNGWTVEFRSIGTGKFS